MQFELNKFQDEGYAGPYSTIMNKFKTKFIYNIKNKLTFFNKKFVNK